MCELYAAPSSLCLQDLTSLLFYEQWFRLIFGSRHGERCQRQGSHERFINYDTLCRAAASHVMRRS